MPEKKIMWPHTTRPDYDKAEYVKGSCSGAEGQLRQGRRFRVCAVKEGFQCFFADPRRLTPQVFRIEAGQQPHA